MIIYSKEKQLLIVPGRDDVVDVDTNEYYQSGYKEGYQEGYDQAYEENYQIGYDKGYADGSAACDDYLAMHITSPGNIVWKIDRGTSGVSIQYSINDEEWTSITSTTRGAQIPVSAGDVVRFKSNVFPGSSDSNYSTFSGTTAGFTLEGNIMSLGGGDNFMSLTKITQEYAFAGLFRSCTKLTDASKLELPATTLAKRCYYNMFYLCTSLRTAPSVLPATTLADYCYASMFYDCPSLTTAPELPATTLARNCYQHMFRSCTSLTTAPTLPATTLADYCYSYMFFNCTSLATPPALPATTLVSGCYISMFYDCTNLNYIKCLATNISAANCTTNWLQGVASTGTFVKSESMSSWPTGNSGIPNNWEIINE